MVRYSLLNIWIEQINFFCCWDPQVVVTVYSQDVIIFPLALQTLSQLIIMLNYANYYWQVMKCLCLNSLKEVLWWCKKPVAVAFLIGKASVVSEILAVLLKYNIRLSLVSSVANRNMNNNGCWTLNLQGIRMVWWVCLSNQITNSMNIFLQGLTRWSAYIMLEAIWSGGHHDPV